MQGSNHQQTTLQRNVFYEFQMALGIAHQFFNVFSTTLIVFFRHRFGERYLNSWSLGIAFLLMSIGSALGGSLANGMGFEGDTAVSSPAITFYSFGFLILGIFHAVSAIRRRRSGERWHSMCPGISHLSRFLPFSLGTVHRVVEPGVAVVLGSIIGSTISGPLGAFIIWSGFSLFFVETMNERQMKNMILDLYDQEIESQQRAAVLIDGKPLAQTEGFTVFGADQFSKETREGLVKAAEGLDPDLRAILQSQSA